MANDPSAAKLFCSTVLARQLSDAITPLCRRCGLPPLQDDMAFHARLETIRLTLEDISLREQILLLGLAAGELLGDSAAPATLRQDFIAIMDAELAATAGRHSEPALSEAIAYLRRPISLD